MSEYKKRLGSTLREYNIKVVVEKLRQGISENDVLNELAMVFCQDTRIDYLNTAKESLKIKNSATQQNPKLPYGLKPNPHIEPDQESLVEYAKKHPKKEVLTDGS